jgi:hypothetical protein
MDATLKSIVWSQFGAAIAMLENAIVECPESVWSDRTRKPEYWYVAYHTLFWLDFYLAESETDFVPPAPFTLGELDPEGTMPDRVYAKDELLRYLGHGREKCRRRIAAMTAELAHRRCAFRRRDISELELLLYNSRHVQHHAAQLYLILRQTTDSAPPWVSKAPEVHGTGAA